jgi:hypothetical protein
MTDANFEGYVLKAEGLGAAFAGAGKVLGGAKEPVEADDAEVNGVYVGAPMEGVREVKDMEEVLEDGDVGRVGSLRGVVLVVEGFEVINQ